MRRSQTPALRPHLSKLAILALLPLIAFADDETCGACHQKEAARFRPTPMAKALEPASQAGILRDHPSLSFQDGAFQWRIVREGDRSVMTVTGKGATITAPLLWAFGRGQAGQTYVFERDGAFYESRVSFYNALNGLDFTMGAQQSQPNNIEDAAGRKMDDIGARDCFGCHSAGAVSAGRLHLESIAPGVRCVSCHVSADQHASAMRSGDLKAAKPEKLAGRGAEDMAELCGRCHRTWSQIASSGPRGVLNVRFQPYRLTNSKCFDTADARIACTACHDPHGPLETAAEAYDSKCAACHSAAQKAAAQKTAVHTKICRVAKAKCVTCHMPTYDLPGAHARFTDHQIRIVRPGEAYPN